MTGDRVAVARLLARVAADAEHRGYPYAGVIRAGARLLLEDPDPTPGGCAACGRELTQPPTGRRRKWCSEVCRRTRRR